MLEISLINIRIYDIAIEILKVIWIGIKNNTATGIFVVVFYCLAVNYRVSM